MIDECVVQVTKAASHIGTGAIGAGGLVFAAVSLVVSPDVLPVVAGFGIGVIGLGWSIYSSGRDRRVTVLTQEIDSLQEVLMNCRKQLQECQEGHRKLYIDNEVLAAKIARLIEENASSVENNKRSIDRAANHEVN